MMPEDRLAAIEERNLRVEADKTWEGSPQRKAAIAIITYLTVLAFMLYNGFSRPFVGSLIPVIGYLLSTLTFPALRKWFTAHRAKSLPARKI